MGLARTNLTIPEDLLAEVDELAGPRGRSRYVAEAVAQRIRRDRLGRAIADAEGSLARGSLQMSRRQVSAWIERLRSEETD
jgi:metal-responsive CopG/Arc/MetJ family transcriptional regulator